jgi:hypothetical protein
MSQKLLDLHMLAAEAQIHQAHFIGGLITESEYKQKIEQCLCHTDIVTEPHHVERDVHYREILDGAIRLANIIKKD